MLSDSTDNAPCIECGLCREVCPVFTVLRQEPVSPRGLAILAKQATPSTVFFQCTLCRACRVACPVGHDPAGEATRADLVRQGTETEANRLMITNIRQYGNPFGPLEEGQVPKSLTCC